MQENPVLEPLYSVTSDVGLGAPVDVANIIYKNALMSGLF